MNTDVNEDLIEQERKDWNKISYYWGKKWNGFVMNWHKPIGDKIIELAGLKTNDIVLDIATGAGEPGLTAAKVVNKGKVIGIDISEELVSIAKETARIRGILNYEALLYDGHKFPFDNDYFDSVISRNGVIFFPDLSEGMREILRVLKNGGRAVISGWGPPENNESGMLVRRLLTEVLNIAPVPLDAPGPYRFSKPGALIALFESAGFKDIREIDIKGGVIFDSPLHYWNFISEMQLPIIDALERADEKIQEKIKSFVIESAGHYEKDGKIKFKWHAKAACGKKQDGQ